VNLLLCRRLATTNPCLDTQQTQRRRPQPSGLESVADNRSAALDRTDWPIDPAAPQRLIIKSISAKQRPRRPGK